MDVIAIHTTSLKQKPSAKSNQPVPKETRHIRVVKTLNAFMFQLNSEKFAIDLSCIVRSSKNYTDIHRFYDKISHIVGFTFINNELVNILNLMEIISASTKTNHSNQPQRLLEIAYNNMKVGVLVDDTDFETKMLQITAENMYNASHNPNQFKLLDAVVPAPDGKIFLLNEQSLFNEIQMKINYNETTRYYQR